MQDLEFRRWLKNRYSVSHTITDYCAEAARVDRYHGNLDEHFARDGMASLIETLGYSAEDERDNRQNPTKIPIVGDYRNNLTSYRSAVRRYAEFRNTGD